jgi:ubiquinone/menaquinone biosynthesis C-methylase UbiE
MDEDKQLEQIAGRYNSLSVIIDDDDKWHRTTKKRISDFIQSTLKHLPKATNLKVLNAGSGGFSYGLDESNILHVDIAGNHLSNLPNSLVADIQSMPINDKQFDLILCVGSVLNYCDPIRVAKEFSRVLKNGGYLILDYENSHTFELLFKRGFNKNAVYVETFFDAHGDKERIWYFSEKYIDRLYASYHFEKITQERFHIISPLIYRLTSKANFSSSFAKLDCFFSLVPVIKRFSSNVIVLFRLKESV